MRWSPTWPDRSGSTCWRPTSDGAPCTRSLRCPTPEVGAERLISGTWFAVAGDDLVRQVVDDLGGRPIEVDDADRAAYHAAAVIASNHLVALLGQAERVAATAGVPLEAYLDLVRATVDNVAELGPAAALTGPAARGDEATLDRHLAALDAIDPRERAAYEAMVALARRLVADQDDPDDDRNGGSPAPDRPDRP